MIHYTILEDCSPYFIRFTFDGLENIIDFVSKQTFLEQNCKIYQGYSHRDFTIDMAKTIIDMLPMSTLFTFKTERVSVFETPPGGGCGIHKDGSEDRVSFNIPIEIHDENCITKWYDDDQLKDFPMTSFPYSRNVYKDYTKLDRFEPVKTMIAQPNEMMLFNTDIFHSWENKSNFTRKVLTFRTVDCGTLMFDDAKKFLFNA